MTSGISRDDWLRALEEAGYHHDDDNDPNAITIEEFATMFQLSRSAAEHRLRALEGKGLASRTKKRVAQPDGRTLRLLAYRLTS